LCRFKSGGRGQRARRALLSAEMVPNAKPQIEAALGELAEFELITGEEKQSQPELPSLVWGRPGSNLQARLAGAPRYPNVDAACQSWRLRWCPERAPGWKAAPCT
jgi:hypothetical protein